MTKPVRVILLHTILVLRHYLLATEFCNESTKAMSEIFHSPRGKSPEKVSANKGNVYSLICAVTRNINDLSHILQDISGFRILYKRRILLHLFCLPM